MDNKEKDIIENDVLDIIFLIETKEYEQALLVAQATHAYLTAKPQK